MNVPELDVDGVAAPPRANGELVFDHPWQRRLFATTMALSEAGVIDYEEFRQRLIVAIGCGGDEYWSSWQDAVERLLADKRLFEPNELQERARRFGVHANSEEPA